MRRRRPARSPTFPSHAPDAVGRRSIVLVRTDHRTSGKSRLDADGPIPTMGPSGTDQSSRPGDGWTRVVSTRSKRRRGVESWGLRSHVHAADPRATGRRVADAARPDRVRGPGRHDPRAGAGPRAHTRSGRTMPVGHPQDDRTQGQDRLRDPRLVDARDRRAVRIPGDGPMERPDQSDGRPLRVRRPCLRRREERDDQGLRQPHGPVPDDVSRP